ncbi:MAG TPA: hypothetical protein PK677_08450 [Acidiphilium sp.]|nr:hypothetical protein [Acidiphilium sp.]
MLDPPACGSSNGASNKPSISAASNSAVDAADNSTGRIKAGSDKSTYNANRPSDQTTIDVTNYATHDAPEEVTDHCATTTSSATAIC